MRLFRAKATSNGNWIYGYPLSIPTTPIVEPTTSTAYIVSASAADYSIVEAQVFTDTSFPKTQVDANTFNEKVGIFGKNLVTVYEGDIITTNIYPFENFNGIVEFNAEKGAFLIRYKKKPTFSGRGIFDGTFIGLEYLQNANIDIIGNVTDNPELL